MAKRMGRRAGSLGVRQSGSVSGIMDTLAAFDTVGATALLMEGEALRSYGTKQHQLAAWKRRALAYIEHMESCLDGCECP